MSPLTDFLREEIERGSFPGAVALVGSQDRILELAWAGHAALSPRRVEVAAETLFDLASLTKPLASGAIVLTARDLALSETPGRYLTGWKRTRYEGITIESLLTHTSGLPAWYPLYVRGEGAAAYRNALCELEPEKLPGSEVVYSDLNFLLLGEILEVHFAAPLDRLFSELVAGPAGSGARFLPENPETTAATEEGDRTERAMTAALGLSYPRFRGGVVWGQVHDGNAFRRGGVAGNAGLFGTAEDVWKLSKRWLSEMPQDFVADRTPRLSEARGFAWQGQRGAGSAGPDLSPRSFGHTGFTGTSAWIDPEAGRISILLTNRVHPEVKPENFNEVRRRFHRRVRDRFG